MVAGIPPQVERNLLPPPPPLHLPQVEFASDASGSWGAGAWCGPAWFQVQWGRSAEALSIAEKELIPIIRACNAWGAAWDRRQVLCHCDNQVVVASIRSRSSRNPGLMHLIRCLVFVEARHNCFIHATYINTRANHLADDLSRNRASHFLSKVPTANAQPSPISQALLHLLLEPQADWISQTWRQRFSDISRQD